MSTPCLNKDLYPNVLRYKLGDQESAINHKNSPVTTVGKFRKDNSMPNENTKVRRKDFGFPVRRAPIGQPGYQFCACAVGTDVTSVINLTTLLHEHLKDLLLSQSL